MPVQFQLWQGFLVFFAITFCNKVEARNLEVPGTCKYNSRHPEIDLFESGFLHVIEI